MRVGYVVCCVVMGGLSWRRPLRPCTGLALVIGGSEDPATPPWHGAVIARGIPGARLRVVRGASHLANVSSPGEVTAALAGHLLSTPAA
ncbi:MAG: alpha/beta fold hydrolase [Streptosporangiales bacterium]